MEVLNFTHVGNHWISDPFVGDTGRTIVHLNLPASTNVIFQQSLELTSGWATVASLTLSGISEFTYPKPCTDTQMQVICDKEPVSGAYLVTQESQPGPTPPGPTPPGPTPTPSADADVVLRDYDGSVVASYTKEEFAVLTELPTPSEHEGLTFQEWNWPLADAQTYCAQYGMAEFGATYITSDGKTRVYITLTDGRTSPTLGLGINGSVDVDWGDGSAHDIMTGSSLSTLVNQQHIYSQPGDYIIIIEVVDNSEFALLGNSTGSSVLWDSSTSTSSYTYFNAVKSVVLGRGVTSIGSRAFQNCYSLKSINIPQGVTSFGSYVFLNCYGLTSINIPQGVTSFGSYVFQNCYDLISITIPDSVTSIGFYMFQNCYSFTRINLPEGVKSIESNAFVNCFSLKSISIPNSLTTWGSNIFSGCYSLTRINLPERVVSFSSSYMFQDCYSLKSINIPRGATTITSSFSNCYSLKSINIPDSVTSISSNAFQNCYSLTSIKFPYRLNIIDSYTFANCYSLTRIDLPDRVSSIKNYAFNNCYSLAKLYIHATNPPSATTNALTGIPADCIIYVPSGSVDAYKAATNWSAHASQIQAMLTD